VKSVRAVVLAAAVLAAASLTASTMTIGAPEPAARAASVSGQAEYTVLLTDPGDPAGRAAALTAIQDAGGQVERENAAVGALVVRAPAGGFVERVAASDGVLGATRSRVVGSMTPPGDGGAAGGAAGGASAAGRARSDGTGLVGVPTGTGQVASGPTGLDPLDGRLWGLAMIKADAVRATQAGDPRVQVGILDSGVDATHPDIAPNFDAELSRNFVTDIPTDPSGAPVDGPCEADGCVDPVGHDDSGHGTHIAGTIAAAANGLGTSGVAPAVTLVSIRGGQDAGLLFLQPVVDALTYGADIGLDVINMSFYIDPWLYNCPDNPSDPPEAQIEQRTTIAAVDRALQYAHDKGVTLVASLGNNHEDLGAPRVDGSSPDFPPGVAYGREIDNASCRTLPVEGPHVIGVSGVGPSGTKADYSNYGVEQISVAAPGGWLQDGYGTPSFQSIENLVLSTYPLGVLQETGAVDATGAITPEGDASGVQKACTAAGCGYYAYLQGTSMAAPYVTGVAALVVSQHGTDDPAHPGHLTMPPDDVERAIAGSAAAHACPAPVTSYAREGRPPEFDAACEGDEAFNGFYGDGIVDAFAAVTGSG
jgi:subtilisin family serine protease